MVDPVTQAAVSAGISASEVAQSVVETVVSANMTQAHDITGGLSNQVVEVSTSVAGQGTEGEVSVGEEVGQVILQTRDGSESIETGAVEAAVHETVGISMPVEILAAMAAQMTQLAAGTEQHALEPAEGIQQVLESVALQPSQTMEGQEQPMDTQ